MKFLDKLFGGSRKNPESPSAPKTQAASAPTINWTRERLTVLFGEEFCNLLKGPEQDTPDRAREQMRYLFGHTFYDLLEPWVQGTLDREGKLNLLTSLASMLQSGRRKITDLVSSGYLAAAVKMIVAREVLEHYVTTAGDISSFKNEMELTLQQSFDSRETGRLVLRMVGEEIRRLKSSGNDGQPSQEGSRSGGENA